MAPRRKPTYTVATTPSSRRQAVPAFVGMPYNLPKINVHHDAVVAAPWLRGLATASLPRTYPVTPLRVLCIMPDRAVSNEPGDATYDSGYDDEKRLQEVLRDHLQRSGLADVPHVDLLDDESDIEDDLLRLHSNLGKAGWTDMPLSHLGTYDVVFADAGFLRHSTYADDIRRSATLRRDDVASRVVYVDAKATTPSRADGVCVIPATLEWLLRHLGNVAATRRLQVAMPWAPPLPVIPIPLG